MLTIAVLLIAALFGSSAAQTTSCVQQGYDLTSITGQDLFYNDTQYHWAIRPCGVVTTPGFCTDFPGGEFCQGGTTVSANSITANVNYTVLSGAIWAQVQYGGQYGVAQLLQDGTNCGAFDREGTIEYICNQTATTPFISSIQELTTCHYQAIIQTSVVCQQVPSTGFSTSVGTSIISSTCGAGIYDLSSINSQDITASISPYQWQLRLCGSVSSPSTCNLTNTPATSVCQSGNVLATYQPSLYPVVYQYIAPGVVRQLIQDGAGCANQNRLTNITLTCNSSATTPTLVSVVENPICHYQLNVQTAAICGQTAFAGIAQPSTGSVASSTGARASSSTGAVTPSSTATLASTASTPTSTPSTYVTSPTSAPSATSTVVVPPTTANSASSALPALASTALLVVSSLALFA